MFYERKRKEIEAKDYGESKFPLESEGSKIW